MSEIGSGFKNPLYFFGIGWSFVMLASWFPIFNKVQTFVLPWRIEVASSIFFILFLSLFYKSELNLNYLKSSFTELYFILIPIVAFVLWSLFSIAWASSGKAALIHALIWSSYLIFYLLLRQILKISHAFDFLLNSLSFIFFIVTVPVVIEYCYFLTIGGATTLGIRFSIVGEQVTTLLPLLIAATLHYKGNKFAVGVVLVTVFELFIIGTLSRTNTTLLIVGIVGISIAVFLFKQFHHLRKKFIILAFCLIITSASIHFLTFLSEKPNIPIVSRVSDETSISASNDFRKLAYHISFEMIKTNPIIGIGANNFGLVFNKYRVIYANNNPSDSNLRVSENEISERTHNEYLQIVSELGIVGGLIFLFFLCGIGIVTLKSFENFREISLYSVASLLGIIMFLVSSLVTSFSFRFMQNGFIFFFLLALAVKSLPESHSLRSIKLSEVLMKTLYGAGMFASAALLMCSSFRAASVYYALEVSNLTEVEESFPLYEKAFWFDNLNPDARFDLGLNLLNAHRYKEAVPYFRKSIDIGRAPSSSYSYLSTAQYLAGDTKSAENTFAEALQLYPFSPFVRTRYAYFLQINGKQVEANNQLEIARKIDKKQTNSWWSLINDGIQLTTPKVFKNPDDFAPVMDLVPGDSLSAIVKEREIRFPEEKINPHQLVDSF